MHLHTSQPLLRLALGEVLTLDDARGARIVAREGTLWVTEEGRATDHIVERGEALTLRHGGRTVVQALAPAWVAIQ